MYSYPETITDELIEEVKTNDKICKYFDIPIQHISDSILKKMNRKTTKSSIKKLIEKLRKEIPNVIIRSTLMVGFPGETDENFAELVDFVEWAKFDKLGCFSYSKEEGTAAAKMPNQIKANVKKARYNKIMKIQQQISKKNLQNKVGKVYKTLLEDATAVEDNNGINEKKIKNDESNMKNVNELSERKNKKISNSKKENKVILIGRTYMDVPEIDGKVYIPVDENELKKIELNTFVNCKITEVEEYDLIEQIKEIIT